jgi:hypothetical protein
MLGDLDAGFDIEIGSSVEQAEGRLSEHVDEVGGACTGSRMLRDGD